MPRTLALMLAAALSLAAPFATAHSVTKSTTPADGSTVEGSPPVIEVEFDAPMRVTSIQLTGADGTIFDVGPHDKMTAVRTFRAEPQALPSGTYTVEWRGLAADGHVMKGRFGFTVE